MCTKIRGGCVLSLLLDTNGGGGRTLQRVKIKGGDHFTSFTGPILFFVHRPHLLIYFDEMLYGSLY